MLCVFRMGCGRAVDVARVRTGASVWTGAPVRVLEHGWRVPVLRSVATPKPTAAPSATENMQTSQVTATYSSRPPTKSVKRVMPPDIKANKLRTCFTGVS